ncbi:MAG TPA: GNAT family N-acetyltransferase, partial [Longimicrobium sp.]|nr:GNAT family N-acetyltransferase [Longimicrobium sp.]
RVEVDGLGRPEGAPRPRFGKMIAGREPPFLRRWSVSGGLALAERRSYGELRRGRIGDARRQRGGKMADEGAAGEITIDERQERFELRDGAETALLTYHRDDDVFYILHTEVPPALEGRGIAGRLVRAALDHARAGGMRVVPFCPYAKTWIRRHAEYQDLVAES